MIMLKAEKTSPSKRQPMPRPEEIEALQAEFDTWLDERFEYPYAALTRKAYRRIVRDLLVQTADPKQPDEPLAYLARIPSTALRSFITRTTAGTRYAPPTRIVRKAALGAFWRFLMERYEFNVDLVREMAHEDEVTRSRIGRGGRKPKRKPAVLSWADQQALLTAVERNPREAIRVRDRAITVLLLATGLRREECCRLQAGDIWPQEGRLRIVGKGNKERIVLFDPTDIDALKSALAAWEPWRQLYCGQAAAQDKEPTALFLTRAGSPLRPSLLYRQISGYIRQAGLAPAHFGPHVLRHTAASRMLAFGTQVRRVMENLGHEHLATLEVYAHLLEAR